jgi:hypothetical protein
LRMAGSVSWRRSAGVIACVLVGLVGRSSPALVVAALLVGVLAAVIASEQVANRRRAGRGDPSPLERLEAGASS